MFIVFPSTSLPDLVASLASARSPTSTVHMASNMAFTQFKHGFFVETCVFCKVYWNVTIQGSTSSHEHVHKFWMKEAVASCFSGRPTACLVFVQAAISASQEIEAERSAHANVVETLERRDRTFSRHTFLVPIWIMLTQQAMCSKLLQLLLEHCWFIMFIPPGLMSKCL